MHSALAAVREKRNAFTIQDLKRLLFRCASFLISVTKVIPTALPYASLPTLVVRLHLVVLHGRSSFRGLYAIRNRRRHRNMDMGHIGTTRVRDCYDGGYQHCVDDEYQVREGYFL
jgi:hypothetical protein